MKISQFTDYSLRVLLYLGLKEDKATVNEISEAFKVSTHHLVKVVHRLSQRGYIHSYKGKNGGIELAQDPHRIGLGKFVMEFESMDLLECFNKETNTCPIQGVCGLERALYNARQAFIRDLDKTTLADLLHTNREKLERMKRLRLSG